MAVVNNVIDEVTTMARRGHTLDVIETNTYVKR